MYCSPLRYPGGKGKFAPCVKEVMHTSGKEYNTYIEPFAGGAGVALELLFSGEVSNIVINDYDKAIYSFWRAILTEHRAFIELIEQTPITIDEWRVQKDIYDTLEVCYEMTSRGYRMSNIDLYRSLATEFRVDPDNEKVIIPPFIILDGLGDNVAISIVEARKNGEFLSKEDLANRTQLSTTLIKKLDSLNVLQGMEETNQISLF